MRLCWKCHGLGRNRHTGLACDVCDGSGVHNPVNGLIPLIILLVALGIVLTAGHWLLQLFSK